MKRHFVSVISRVWKYTISLQTALILALVLLVVLAVVLHRAADRRRCLVTVTEANGQKKEFIGRGTVSTSGGCFSFTDAATCVWRTECGRISVEEISE